MRPVTFARLLCGVLLLAPALASPFSYSVRVYDPVGRIYGLDVDESGKMTCVVAVWACGYVHLPSAPDGGAVYLLNAAAAPNAAPLAPLEVPGVPPSYLVISFNSNAAPTVAGASVSSVPVGYQDVSGLLDTRLQAAAWHAYFSSGADVTPQAMAFTHATHNPEPAPLALIVAGAILLFAVKRGRL